MSWFRKNPIFATAMVACGVLGLGELGLIYERFAASREAAKKLEQRRTELQGMTELTPPPTREIARAIEADLEKAQRALASMQSELKGRGAAAEKLRAAKAPAARTDAYFDLATFVERMRALATKREVDVRPEAARFGFAAFTNEGPEAEHIEPVFHQRQIAEYLIAALLEAQPRTLLAVKREPTVTKAEREARAAALASGETPPQVENAPEGPDYFTVDPRVSARVPGHIDTVGFRFAFTGQTAALRNFLNRLASFELPVLVREVEVDTATAEETAATPAEEAPPAEAAPAPSVVLTADEPPAPAAPAAPKPPAPRQRAVTATPIVSKPFSKFTVTVEFVELVPPPAAAAADAPAPPPTQ